MITFNEIDDGNPALVYSPMVHAVEKIFAYIDEHDAIPQTQRKAFNWPGYSEAEPFTQAPPNAAMEGRKNTESTVYASCCISVDSMQKSTNEKFITS